MSAVEQGFYRPVVDAALLACLPTLPWWSQEDAARAREQTLVAGKQFEARDWRPVEGGAGGEAGDGEEEAEGEEEEEGEGRKEDEEEDGKKEGEKENTEEVGEHVVQAKGGGRGTAAGKGKETGRTDVDVAGAGSESRTVEQDPRKEGGSSESPQESDTIEVTGSVEEREEGGGPLEGSDSASKLVL
jgi:hypothetical protein